MNAIEIMRPVEITLAEHAEVIRTLGKRVVGDVIEIGRRLAEAKALCRHGEWLPWLDQEFGWTDRHAINYMRVHAMAYKSENFSDLDLPVSGLYLLARPSTPSTVIEKVIEIAETGERISLDDVRRMIEEAKAEVSAEQTYAAEQRIAKLQEEAAARLKKEIAASAERMADLQSQIDTREAQVRDEYKGKLVLDAAQLEAEIAKQLAPLTKELETARKRLDEARWREKRREQEAADSNEKKLPKIDAKLALQANTVIAAVERLASNLKIDPVALIDVEAKSAVVTNQKFADRIGEAHANAKRVHEWLGAFLQQVSMEIGKG